MQQWKNELKAALELYNEGDIQGCIAHINTVFRDTSPSYLRTRYYALLACCAEDWRIAEQMRTRAESTYTSWCIHNRYLGAERRRLELRAILDEVDEKLKSRRPGDSYEHQLTWTEDDANERQAERKAELAEAMLKDDAVITGEEMEANDSVTEGEVEDDADITAEKIKGDADISGVNVGNTAEAAEGKVEDYAEIAEGQWERDADIAEGELEDGAADHEAEMERLADLAEAEMEYLAELAEAEEEEEADQY